MIAIYGATGNEKETVYIAEEWFWIAEQNNRGVWEASRYNPCFKRTLCARMDTGFCFQSFRHLTFEKHIFSTQEIMK